MDRLELVADCGSCFGLCCVALAFERSADFPVDKDAGEPCVNLDDGFGCSIHATLRDVGYRGCTVYDCFGAGQQVSQVTFGGMSWREAPETSAAMFAALPIMRQLHEMLWYLAEAAARPEAATLRDKIARLRESTVELTQADADVLDGIDLPAHRDRVSPVLQQASALVREPHDGPDHRGAAMLGAKRRGARLRGADFRGALLIAADLRDADLRSSDLLGADLRDARLDGADLTDCLFLTQTQVSSAQGDAATRIPPALRRPAHWVASP
ncbi:pentapeptide repeat-containing protein [Aeromicrobium fastidiosum]|uniref:Pentapeptide repeat-containing protein n=1 Tax=Aeromicrobium fastidiosum TaxID=52699 RepID=A0A641AQT8_9ACTN|nr:pentapeptide repeat-containing protein [Aeromicrobium fastidiosum]KAA1378452.1 pentapeptide repeat-containing protein [Aeromicrobium fastidiosum]MBP2392584.1 uncharacterized protein YjbI with pentapeptide repeats [Aeromicrobium fastidiosum]